MSLAGSGCELITSDKELLDVSEIEKSIIKMYRSKLWTPFMKAIKDFEMIKENDHIACCISGGKDSLLLAKALQELQKHGKTKFELSFIAMDPGFYKTNRDKLVQSCEHLEIPVQIFESDIFEIVEKIAKDYPCYMCAKMRRGSLYTYAANLGCNKVALGHHFDDVIETTMMNVFYAGSFKTMLPRLKSSNYENMELIRPLYYVRENDIINFTKNSGLNPMNCGCEVQAGKTSSKRREIKDFIKEYKKIHGDVDKSIFAAAQNVNLDGVLAWTKNRERFTALDDLD